MVSKSKRRADVLAARSDERLPASAQLAVVAAV